MLQTQPKTFKITKEGALAELCKRSCYRFFREFIEIIEPSADKYVWNWHIKYLCDQLQALVFIYKNGGDTYNLNINICPGATKSTLFSRIATPWIWTVMPEATTINVSRDTNNVKEFALKSKDIVKSEKYRKLFPYVKIKSEPDSMFYYENDLNGRRYGLTTKSSGSTGKHADFIFLDDAYAYNDLESAATVTSLETSLEGYLSRFKDKSKGVVINVMQRLGTNDATAFLFTGYIDSPPKLKNYKNICLPAINNDMVSPQELKENYIDGLLDPVRLNNDILEQEKLKYGYKYDAQFNQDPILNKEGLMYKELTYYEHDTPEGTTFSFTDPADRGDDYLCSFYVRVTDTDIYVYDAIYTKDDSGVTIPRLADKMNFEKCVVNWIETNSIGSVFVSQLQDKVTNIDGRFETRNKTARIMHYSHLIEFIKFKSTGSNEYMKAIQHLKKVPRTMPNSGKGLDVDSADVVTSIIRYFYTNYPHYFVVK